MNCKFCQAELEEGVTLCPACGQENQPEEELPVAEVTEEAADEETVGEVTEAVAEEAPVRKKLTSGKLAVIYISIIVLLAALIAPIIADLNKGNSFGGNIALSDPIFADRNKDDVTCKGSYTVTDKKAKEKADKVVATAGDAELTNGMLQSIYWLQVYNFMGSYGQEYEIDMNVPLDEQRCTANQNEWSWQQYFLDVALQEWQMYNAFCQEAEAVDYESTMDFDAFIETMRSELEDIASSQGFPSAEQMILHDMGPGASLEDYLAFLELTERGYDYYGSLYTTIVPTEDQIVAYYEENLDLFEESGITEDAVLVDVRHILLQPADMEDEQSWLDCEKEAQDMLDQWLAGDADETSFAALANEHSVDGGSNTNGGLYQYVQEGRMVQEFNDWCFDASRETGDYGIVKTTHGYHIMFFVGKQPMWRVYAQESAKNEMVNETMEALMEKYPVDIKYSKIVLGTAAESFGG